MIETFNTAAERMFGYSAEEVIQSSIRRLLPDPLSSNPLKSNPLNSSQKGFLERYLVSAASDVNGHNREVIAQRKDGSTFPIEFLVSEAWLAERRLFVGLIRDITQRRQTEEKIERHLSRLSALRSIDLAINASVDIQLTLNILLDNLVGQLGVDGADILLLNPHTHLLEYTVERGYCDNAIRSVQYRLGEGRPGQAALQQRLISDIEAAEDIANPVSVYDDRPVGYYAVPLITKGKVKGVLEVFLRQPRLFDADWLSFLEILAGQAAIAIDNATLFEELQRSNSELSAAYDATIEGWSRAIDLRDKETEGHSQRVAEMAVRLSKMMGFTDAELVHIRRGALLHDIGKLGVPDNILLKPGALTEDERELMKRHPTYAYEWLSPVVFLKNAIDIPYYHHEKWDGTGYPHGLKGDQIPLSARIFAVADVWDALRSDRPYRPSWPAEIVRDHIMSLRGSHFDPDVVDMFLKMELT